MAGKEATDEVCRAKGAPEPLEFLASLAAGVDPRTLSDVYIVAQQIEDDNFGGPPTTEQWEELLAIIERDYKQAPVPLGISKAAATTLAEYQHPKRKSIELAMNGPAASIPPLTAEELDLFEEWFNGQF